MLQRIVRQFGVVLAGVVLLVAAVSTLVLELRTEQLGWASPARTEQLLTGAIFPLSERAEDAVAEGCYGILRSTYFKALTTSARKQTLQTCETAVTKLVRKTPTHGLARLALAQIAAFGKSKDFNALLRDSAGASPNSTWLRLRRLDMSLEHQAALDDGSLALRRDDLDVLLRTPVGLQNLARRYLANPELGKQIAAAADDAPPDIQRAFVDAVRTAGAQN